MLRFSILSVSQLFSSVSLPYKSVSSSDSMGQISNGLMRFVLEDGAISMNSPPSASAIGLNSSYFSGEKIKTWVPSILILSVSVSSAKVLPDPVCPRIVIFAFWYFFVSKLL